MREVALMLTRASIAARAEGRYDDERRILKALSALLSLDDEPASTRKGTRVGIGPLP